MVLPPETLFGYNWHIQGIVVYNSNNEETALSAGSMNDEIMHKTSHHLAFFVSLVIAVNVMLFEFFTRSGDATGSSTWNSSTATTLFYFVHARRPTTHSIPSSLVIPLSSAQNIIMMSCSSTRVRKIYDEKISNKCIIPAFSVAIALVVIKSSARNHRCCFDLGSRFYLKLSVTAFPSGK